jgi:adenine-specific DNA-methyltransferase
MGDLVRVIHGDCLAVFPTLEAGSVDAIVTDPPFGIGFTYGDKREFASDPVAYWDWLGPRMDAALECLKPGGFVAVWQVQLNFRHFWDWFGPDIHVYCAAKNFVQMRPTPINYGYDPVVMFYKSGGPPLRPDNPQRSVDFFVADTASVVSQKGRPEKGHPCPRPLDQIRVILDNFVLPGGVVLDPFAGSGTTLVACVKTGRAGVGIEIEGRYIEIIHRRLRGTEAPLFNRQAATPLFADAPA